MLRLGKAKISFDARPSIPILIHFKLIFFISDVGARTKTHAVKLNCVLATACMYHHRHLVRFGVLGERYLGILDAIVPLLSSRRHHLFFSLPSLFYRIYENGLPKQPEHIIPVAVLNEIKLIPRCLFSCVCVRERAALGRFSPSIFFSVHKKNGANFVSESCIRSMLEPTPAHLLQFIALYFFSSLVSSSMPGSGY